MGKQLHRLPTICSKARWAEKRCPPLDCIPDNNKVQENFIMRHYIDLSEQALLQIIINGLEAFVVIHNGHKRSGIEMHGHFFGSTESTASTIRHKIDFFSADTSAVMMPGHCISDNDNRVMKSEIAKSFSKNNRYNLLGSLHTHPYTNFELRSMNNVNQLIFMRNTACNFSDEDINSFLQKINIFNTPYIIEGIFAINDRPRQSIEGDGKIKDNIFEFSLGNLKCFINIQAFSLDKNKNLAEVPTILKCEYLEKFHYIASSFDFGRIKIKENKKRIFEYKPT